MKSSEYRGSTKKQLEDQFEEAQKNLAIDLAREDILPTITANYYSWMVEKNMWTKIFHEKEGPGCPKFPFECPEMFGQPYSLIYLSHLFDTEERRLKEKALGPVGVEYELPPGVKRNWEYLVSLWERMVPGRPYEEGCDKSFMIRFGHEYGEIDYHKCIARDPDETSTVMQKAA
ncbi:hypothetical protein F4819DRAFT_483801 [Hypoxylon fuscum]|nr:hypothetical protein F4819DRAFT_483801 [Hypoxylon fuscum]